MSVGGSERSGVFAASNSRQGSFTLRCCTGRARGIELEAALLNKNEHGHEYLSDTTGREGRSGSRKRAALQQRACMSQAQKADIDQGRECSKDGAG